MRVPYVFLLAFVVVSCSLEGITKPSTIPPRVRDYYLPFVDSVSVPTTASVWEELEVKMSLHADTPDDLLNGVTGSTIGGSSGKVVVNQSDVWIRPWIYATNRTGLPADTVTIVLPRLVEGDYTIHIQTADSLENSAVFAQVEGNFFIAPEPPGTHYLEFPLTVLPAEEAAP